MGGECVSRIEGTFNETRSERRLGGGGRVLEVSVEDEGMFTYLETFSLPLPPGVW